MCSENGICLSQEMCIADINPQTSEKDTQGYGTTMRFEVVKMLDACRSVEWSMGNSATVNQYCGEDPLFTVVHDEVVKTRHFEGCGLERDQCTNQPCCNDALTHNFTSATCNDTVIENIALYDSRIKTISNITTTCFDHF